MKPDTKQPSDTRDREKELDLRDKREDEHHARVPPQRVPHEERHQARS